jgi:hypothetical protein
MSGFTNISVVSGGIRVPVEPGGPASGDLSGYYPSPIVAQIQQFPVDPRTPSNGETLIFNGDQWIPTPSPTSTTIFQGVWDASTPPASGTPDIANTPGLSDGYVWIVGTGGNATVGGITGWIVGDYAVYSGGNWYKLSASSFGWLLQGNNGTNPSVNFIGTADEHDLSIRANAIEGLRVFTDGTIRAASDLTVLGNLTGSNAQLSGNLAVNGGSITTTAATFNVVNSTATTVNIGGGASTALNIGNVAGTNTVSGASKFPQGLSGSLTKLTDGTSAFVASTGIVITSASNGAVTFTMGNTGSAGTYGTVSQVPIFTTDAQGRVTSVTNTSIQVSESQVTNLLADLTASVNALNSVSSSLAADKANRAGDTFTGAVTFNAGLSGSLTKLKDGTSYLIAGTNMTVVTNSNGSVTLTAIPSGSSTQVQFNDGGSVFGGTAGFTFDKTTSSVTVAGDITGSNERLSGNLAVNGGSITTTATTFNLVNATPTTVNIGGNATVGVRVGNSVGTNIVSGTTVFPQGISGSHTKLADGTSAFIAGGNIAITSASNGPVTVAFSTPVAPTAQDVLIYSGSSWTASSIISTLQTSYQTVLASEAIAAGDVCYIVNSGGSGANPTVARAQANSLATVHGVIGLATANIAKNATGTVQTYGQLIGPVDTHTFGQGDPLYVSATTPGGVTNVKPAGPNFTFQIGVVTRQGQPLNPTSGIVFVSPIMQTDTQNISDFVFSTPIEHDVLTYDPATSTWKNRQPLHRPETQTAVTLAAGGTITAANFSNVIYLPIKTAGGANVTLSATTPIAALTKTDADYGRELWLYNADNTRNILIPSGGTAKLETAALVAGNLVLSPGAFVKFLWTGLGGNGAWVQTSKVLIVA